MVRGGGGDIPGNDTGQGFTSPSTCTHVQGVSGAPTAADGGAADGRRSMRRTSLGTRPLSAGIAKNRVENASGGTERRPKQCTLVGQRFRWGLTHIHVRLQ